MLLNLIIDCLEAMAVGEEPRELLISCPPEDPEKGSVRVAVRDSGPGLGQADTERVFAAFYTTKPGGMGLGFTRCGRYHRGARRTDLGHYACAAGRCV